MNLRGKWAEKNLKKSLNYTSEAVVIRWPDFRDFISVKCPRCSQIFKAKYQAPKSPADYIVLHGERYAFIEVKSCSENASYVYKSKKNGECEYHIREHQLEWGFIVEQIGGKYFFVLYRGKEEVFLIHPSKLKELIDINDKAGRTRIRWEDVREQSIIADEIGKRPKIFDSKKMIEAIFDD